MLFRGSPQIESVVTQIAINGFRQSGFPRMFWRVFFQLFTSFLQVFIGNWCTYLSYQCPYINLLYRVTVGRYRRCLLTVLLRFFTFFFGGGGVAFRIV
jgi:hypothetical protein